MAKDNGPIKILSVNRRARFNYEIEETFECGIELVGTEVKSIKNGTFSYSDSYGRIRDDQIWLAGFHVTPYEYGNIFNHDPDRERRLLIHKQEIKRLKRKIDERGFSLVPTRVYLKRGLVKIEMGIGKGKKTVDKRESIKARDVKRETEREFRSRY